MLWTTTLSDVVVHGKQALVSNCSFIELHVFSDINHYAQKTIALN